MTNENSPSEPDLYDKALAEYLARVDRGENVDRETFIAQHPEFADQLRVYFQDADAVDAWLGLADETLGRSPGTSIGAAPPRVDRNFGDYELLREVGRGGMGVVYKARQCSLKRIVAVKMVLAGELATLQDIERFHAEAEAAASLKHRNVVRVHEVGVHAGQHYFSMDFVHGEDLAALARDTPLAPKRAASYVEKVARAVEYAHQQGTLHRDLKPSNILIDGEDEPVVTDFGLAKQVQSESDLTATSQVLGSPSYMPPEQAAGRNDDVGPWSDVYSLGATLYRLLTGRPPHCADSPAATLLQVLHAEPVAPRLLNTVIDRDLETICLRCLEKEPARRYVTPVELAEELTRFLRGEPIQSRPVSRLTRAWRWCQRNRTVATLGAVVSIVLVVGIIVSMMFAVHAIRQQGIARNAEQQAEYRRLEADAQRQAAELSRQQAEQQTRQAQLRAYDSDLISAHVAFRSGNIRLTRRLLARQMPTNGAEDFRGFEWYYLYDGCDQSSVTLLPPSENIVNCLAFSPDGRFLVAGGATNGNWQRGFFRVWDTTSWRMRVSANDDRGPVSAMAFPETGSRLALGWGGVSLPIPPIPPGAITIWQLGPPAAPFSLPFSGHQICGLAFVQEDRLVVANAGSPHTAVSGELAIWDIDKRKRLRRIAPTPTKDKMAGASNMDRMVVSRNQEMIASFTGASIRLWSFEGRQLGQLESDSGIADIAFTGSGDKLVSVGNAGIEVWDPGTLKLVRHISAEECDSFFSSVTPADSPQTMIVGGRLRSGTGASLACWNIEEGRNEHCYMGHDNSVEAVAYSDLNHLLASAERDGALKIWRYPATSRFSELCREEVSLWACLFSEDGNTVITGDDEGTLLTWSHDGKDCNAITKLNAGVVGGANMQRRPGTDTVVVAQRDQTIVLCHLGDGSHEQIGTIPAEAFSSAFSSDGSFVAVSGGMRTGFWRIWRIEDCQVVAERLDHVTTVYEIVFAPSGRAFATAHGDRKTRLWKIGESSPYRVMARQGRESARSICFSADSTKLFAGTFEGDFLVYDVESGDLLSSVHAHGETVIDICRSPDGRRLLTSSSDGKICIWNAETLQELLSIKAPMPRSANLSADGRTLAAIVFDRETQELTTRIWSTRSVRPAASQD